jgi:hypothetical protein
LSEGRKAESQREEIHPISTRPFEVSLLLFS